MQKQGGISSKIKGNDVPKDTFTLVGMKKAGSTSGGKIFAIGDIHGCHAKLAELIGRFPYDRRRDTLVFLGDYIDRGPEAKEVISLLCRLQDAGGKVIALMGNHEYLMLEFHRTGDEALLPFLRQLDSDKTLASYGAANLAALRTLSFLPDRHRRFFETLLPYWETDEYIFVHAGLEPGRPLADHDLPTLCETRGLFLTEDIDFGRRVIFGHTPFATPLVTPTKIGIDTGAAYGNLLTAVELPAVRFYHA